MSGVALGNGGDVENSPARELIEDGGTRIVGEFDPGGNLVERAEAAGAQPGRLVHHAKLDAGRGANPLRAPHRAPAGKGSFALSARATRETGGRPRNSEMNCPAV